MPKKPTTVLSVKIVLINQDAKLYNVSDSTGQKATVIGHREAIKKARESFNEACDNLELVAEVMEG